MQKEIAAHLVPEVIGTPFEGGYFNGLYWQDGQKRALITAGIEGEIKGAWGEYGQDVLGARSQIDGMANTIAMADAGSELANKALALRIGGFDDWCMPAHLQREMQYRHFKPTDDENACSFGDGDNPLSTPPGYLYTEESPEQTTVESFRAGEYHAFSPAWYWSSTQFSSGYAWGQGFSYGGTNYGGKDYEARVRAVRSVVITN